jgi:imidazolonepropionase-like amidohydrolase
MKNIFLTCVALWIWQICLPQRPQNKYTLVITNANVVDVEHDKVIPNRLLAISGNTIQTVDDTKKQNQYKAVQYLDAQNKYVLPGLWDMHVHFRGGDTLVNENKALLPLFLAYGITTVRDAGGDITPAVLQWRKQTAAGTLAGPKIFTSGPKIDGRNSGWPGSLRVETSDEVSKALDSLQKLGVDYVKLYDGGISREAFRNVIVQAEKRGLRTTGHLPITVKAAEAAQAGLDAIEHMLFIFIATSSKEDSITLLAQRGFKSGKPLNIFSALPIAFNSYSQQSASKLYSTLVKNHTAVVPTLYVIKTGFAELKESDHSRDSLLAYIDPKIQATYQWRVNNAKNQSAEATRLYKKLSMKFMEMIPQMQAAGVTLLAGSDCGTFNSFTYPGQSLHEEIKLMVAAGLTPVQALQAATINGAKFMGVDNFYGTIQAGKSSDMIMIEKNPLTDIGAIDNISTIISNGHVYSKSDLNNLLKAIKH